MSIRPGNMWRWRELMPVRDAAHIVTLVKGGTPAVSTFPAGAQLDCTISI